MTASLLNLSRQWWPVQACRYTMAREVVSYSLWQVDVFEVQDDTACVRAQRLARTCGDRLATHLQQQQQQSYQPHTKHICGRHSERLQCRLCACTWRG
jgi:hypothetical protein